MKLKPIRLSYKQQLIKVGQGLCISTLMFLAVPAALVKAQITPDGSLPTSVEQQGENELNINGGEREGNNLFHSFEEFSVPEGIEAVFENAPDIENIFTRITGDAASDINGILRTQGGANFFLVNPNGIVFGENARLDVGGSFIATTADSIQFEDGTEFATSGADEQPILTVSVPIGLQFDGGTGAIAVNGTGNQIASDTRFSPIDIGNTETGLSVITGKTLALIGGNINFSGGIITAEGGRVEIGSVDSGLVSLQEIDSKLAFGYANADNYQDISLSQQTLLNTSGEGQSEILLTGNNISFSDGSFILSQNRGSVDSGIIAINAFGSLNLSGFSLNGEVSSSIRSESLGNGQGAKIDINTKQLLVLDEALIIASSYGEADGNELTINASDSVEIVNSSISASTFAEGNAGSLKLSTSHFQVKNGGILTSSTVGTGNGGEVTVNADLIEVIGGSGRDRTNISASSFNAGNAGSLIIETEQLKIQDGGAVSSTAFAEGNAGGLSIKASESVEVSGIQQNASFANPESSIRTAVQAASPPAQQALGLPAIPTGNSGSLTLETPFLSIFQQGAVNVENQGTGDGGSLSINADRLNLDEAGNITAASASGTGGNIDLNTENLQIDDGSSITATAENNGDGGNISINTATLVAKKNSEVTANSFQGRGGNLDINAEGLFLFDSPENIFSASSELGIDGTIQINTPDINLQRELEQSKPELLTAEQAIANSCLARISGQASFTVDGDGEFPKNPNSNYSDANFSLTGVGSLSTNDKQPSSTQAGNSQSDHLAIPAEKMVGTEDGRIFLVAAPRKAKSIYCHSAEEE